MPTILVVGATGNTGVGVTTTLSELRTSSPSKFSSYKILGTTRSTDSPSSKKLAALDGIEMIEKDWTTINHQWLKEHSVTRVFIASHNGPTHFTDESLFYWHALQAKVEYVVRISTTKSNIAPDTKVWYARNHWAIEALLAQPEYNDLKWTSLQPNVFTPFISGPAEEWLKQYRQNKTVGKEEIPRFDFMLDGDAGVAVVDPYEVGICAAKLLLEENTSAHNSQKYVVVGPSDLSGKGVQALLEKHSGVKITDTRHRDQSGLEQMMRSSGMSDNLVDSILFAPETSNLGLCSVEQDPTSPALAKLYQPKNGALDAIDKALAAM
jgi:uncharacterized protein YbjT (DUF2867 family)